jgi:hypothetical protein
MIKKIKLLLRIADKTNIIGGSRPGNLSRSAPKELDEACETGVSWVRMEDDLNLSFAFQISRESVAQ